MRQKPRKVVVAMSGGVDSSVAAALLQEKGYEVIGMTMNLYALPRELCLSEELRSCCGWEATEDAHAVAIHIGIPHFVVDFRREFERSVVTDFCREYSRGRTPNPCLRCNEHIKFKLFWERAKRLGADYIATGHHARVALSRSSGRYLLKKGKDKGKDQSCFLYPLTQEELGRTLMPIGNLTKPEGRALAEKWDLPVASRPESQEICFVPLGRYPEFLKERIPEAFLSGPVQDTKGRILGKHQGIIHFTVGQRRGMGIAAAHPLYVVSIDAPRNAVIVGAEKELYRRRLLASRVKMISGERLEKPVKVRAKIRYKHEEAAAVVTPLTSGRVVVEFEKPQRAMTPGQSVVFYRRDTVLGAGIIDQALD